MHTGVVVHRMGVTGSAITVVLAVGCAHQSPNQQRLAACRQALPGMLVVGTGRATVEEVRDFTFGPSGRMALASAFPSAAPGQAALWCYTQVEANRTYTAWAVYAGKAVKAATFSGDSVPPPSGYPASL